MHRFHNKSAVQRFRIVALLFCAKVILVPLTGGILIYSIIVHNCELTVVSLKLLLLTILVTLLQWLIAARAHCPLCMTPVLARKRCSKHRQSRMFLGSHRLPVALSILCKNSFLCPYCNERSAMKVRDRKQPHMHSKG